MLEQVAAYGTPANVRERVARLERRYDHATLCSPSFTLSPERVRDNTAAIVETFRTEDTEG